MAPLAITSVQIDSVCSLVIRGLLGVVEACTGTVLDDLSLIQICGDVVGTLFRRLGNSLSEKSTSFVVALVQALVLLGGPMSVGCSWSDVLVEIKAYGCVNGLRMLALNVTSSSVFRLQACPVTYVLLHVLLHQFVRVLVCIVYLLSPHLGFMLSVEYNNTRELAFIRGRASSAFLLSQANV